jgi:hypothetical protein
MPGHALPRGPEFCDYDFRDRYDPIDSNPSSKTLIVATCSERTIMNRGA